MSRLLIGGAILVLLAGGLIFGLAKHRGDQVSSEVPSPGDLINSVASPQPVPNYSDSGSYVSRKELLAILEASTAAMNKKIDSINKSAGVTINPPQIVPPSNSVGVKTVYIPIGTGGSSTSGSYESIGAQEAVINAGDYPGYKSMALEVSMRIYQGNGTGYARLYNKTDGVAISNSDVSTGSQDFGLKTSGTFSLPSGSKTYTVQLKSTSSYSVDLQSVRIRVDF